MSVADDTEVLLAQAIAYSARRQLQTFHRNGVFNDEQAPALNFALRQHVYDVLTAQRHVRVFIPNDPFEAYLRELAGGWAPHMLISTIPPAICLAVQEFADTIGCDAKTAREMKSQAVRGAINVIQLRDHMSEPAAAEQFVRLLARVPEYWEAPEPSPYIQRLLRIKMAPLN